MVKQVTKWEARGQLFDNEAAARAYDLEQGTQEKIVEFLSRRGIDYSEAENVASIMWKNLGWFRTVLDEAAAGTRKK